MKQWLETRDVLDFLDRAGAEGKRAALATVVRVRGSAYRHEGAKLAVEPAGAAATAALMGPLRERLRGKRVGVIVCGSNIDAATFSTHLAASIAASGLK